MRNRFAFCAIVAVAAILGLAGCSSDSSDEAQERIDSFAVDYTLSAGGLVHVIETIDYDFGSNHRHGIDRFLDSRFLATGGQDRVYKYSHLRVSSPTGASALFSTGLQTALQIRIGNSNATTSGKQTYVLHYDVTGALNRTTPSNGTALDEFYWNATGIGWDVPIDKTTVAVHGPADVSLVACASGPAGSTTKCAVAASRGSEATFGAGPLSIRQGLTIDTAWPSGTFAATAPILETHLPYDAPIVLGGSNDGPDPFWTPWNWGLGLGLMLGIPFAFGIFVISRRRDEELAGEAVVVEYQPPDGVPVGAANTLLTKARKNVDITATLVDLAVRGYLTIEEVPGGKRGRANDYKLTSTPDRAAAKRAAATRSTDATDLLPHETLLLADLFKGERTTVTLSALRYSFAPSMDAIKAALGVWIDGRGWFLDKLTGPHPFLRWSVFGSIILFLVLLIFVPKGWTLIPIGVFVGSLASLRNARRAVRRSALGHAIFLQLEGFHRYIATAEAGQIRFEENEDVFSRYLPWAIAFGETKRWARVFKELTEDGRFTSTPDWYSGNTGALSTGMLVGAAGSLAGIGSAMESFGAMAQSSMTASAPTTSSSGGSGFSSGGSSSGGGGGGGGGGSW